ncbi:MAG: tRNA threonylcarbamoyladenosine dehydratase [Candidatus Methanomethylophilaceae archaeon]|nr:tRNA threonylcarbamoyladenosine dehydratase [Candidatus Methanomethylophilaceae archaeon]
MADGISDRTGLLLGDEGVERLRSASVVLCGCGAVGGYALEGLVRAGVGRIRVVDADVFSGSNLNRQILATVDTVGRPKAEVACERARSINPDIDIEAVSVMVSESTVPGIVDGGYGILVDAIDTVEHKVALLRHAASTGTVTFSSMGAALHIDTQMIRVAPLASTRVCPLAAAVRKRTRDLDTSRITCVFSEEPPIARPGDRDEHGKSVLGSLPTVPAVFGMTLANLAIRHIVEGR